MSFGRRPVRQGLLSGRVYSRRAVTCGTGTDMNSRKWIQAMAVVALFGELASAQVIIGANTGTQAGPLTCAVNVSVPNTLRSEGMTELLGDIVIQCTGGNPLVPGSAIPTANITVSLTTGVTSRLIPTGTNPTNTSEALLLIDEPNTNLAGAQGVGPTASFTVCSNATLGAAPGGCAQVVSNATAGGPS